MAWSLFGVRILVAPDTTAAALAFVAAGITLGVVSGLTPGLHVNALAALLAVVAPHLPGPPHLVGAALLAAGVTHSFLDIVPSLALGVPDAAMAVTALPGHRLVLAGRGREALRLSAVGSASAVGVAALLGYPVTLVMVRLAPIVDAHLPLLLACVALALLVMEPSWRARVGGVLSLAASGALGLALLDQQYGGVFPTGDALLPLLTGLFGVPVLLAALRGEGIPPQGDAVLCASRREVVSASIAGAGAGGLVGYLPGVSSAIAGVFALTALPGRTGDRSYVVAISGVNTANAIFALLAYVALRDAHTGVLVAMDDASVPLNLPLLLAAVALAACVGAVLVPILGDRALLVAGSLDNRQLSLGVLGFLVVLVLCLTGITGIGALAVAALVGLLPTKFGARRVHLMGVLLVPIAVGV